MNQTEKENNCCPHCIAEEHKREPLWIGTDEHSDFSIVEDFEGHKRIATCRNAVEFDWSYIEINFCPKCGKQLKN